MIALLCAACSHAETYVADCPPVRRWVRVPTTLCPTCAPPAPPVPVDLTTEIIGWCAEQTHEAWIPYVGVAHPALDWADVELLHDSFHDELQRIATEDEVTRFRALRTELAERAADRRGEMAVTA